jgi:hypothetical protein
VTNDPDDDGNGLYGARVGCAATLVMVLVILALWAAYRWMT